MSAVQIRHLFETPGHRQLVAHWIFEEFWVGRDGYSVDFFAALLASAVDPDRIPLCLVAWVDGVPAGTVNLIDNDDAARAHLHPWLAALLVLPQYRRRGVGSALVRALQAHAGRLGFAQVFFGTDGPGFYRRLGAQPVEQPQTDFWIMRLACAAAHTLP